MEENKQEQKVENKKVHKKTKRFKWFMIGFLVGLIFCVFAYLSIKNDIISNYLSKNKFSSIDISSDIRKMSELVTAELEYQSVLEIKDENAEEWHAIFTSKEMLLLYKGKISAGIDLTNAIVEDVGNKIVVKIPHATIKHKEIDPDSLRVYNTKNALPLISISDEDLLIDALKRAYDDMNNNSNTTNIIDFAEKQAKEVIEQFVHSINAELFVQIEYIDDVDSINQSNANTNESNILETSNKV